MGDFFDIVSRLDGELYKAARKLKGVLEDKDLGNYELFSDCIFGAFSFLYKGKVPRDVPSRLPGLRIGVPFMQILVQKAQPKWSALGRYAFFEVMMHSWVVHHISGSIEEIKSIPHQMSEFEVTEVGLIAFILQDLGNTEFASIKINFEQPLLICEEVVLQGLGGEVFFLKFEQAREAFAKLQPLFDTLWNDEPQDIVLRGYLAGLGFCLSWLELQNANS